MTVSMCAICRKGDGVTEREATPLYASARNANCVLGILVAPIPNEMDRRPQRGGHGNAMAKGAFVPSVT